jgi:SAM-dependent methyltransferase
MHLTIGGEHWSQYEADGGSARVRLAFDLDRLRDMMDLLSDGTSSGPVRTLELGAAPYLMTTAMLQAGYEVTVNGLPVDNYPREGSLVVNDEVCGERRLTAQLFDIEERFPFDDESFDIVVAGEVFEHLYRQPWVMLHEAHRCLAVGGMLVLSTPNGHAIEYLHRWIRRTGTGLGFNPAAPSVRHAREYSVAELREVTEASGFVVERLFTRSYTHVGADGFPGRLGPVKRRLATMLRQRSERDTGFLGARGNTILLTARKTSAIPVIPAFMQYATAADSRTGYNFAL